jgi:hypothetical protein
MLKYRSPLSLSAEITGPELAYAYEDLQCDTAGNYGTVAVRLLGFGGAERNVYAPQFHGAARSGAVPVMS